MSFNSVINVTKPQDIEIIISGTSLFYPYGSPVVNPRIPAFVIQPSIDNIDSTSFDITTQLNVNGFVYGYYKLSGATAPNKTEILSNYQSSYIESGSGGLLEFTGLTASTNYNVYVLGADNFGNTSIDYVTLSAETLSNIETYIIRQIFRDRGFTSNIYNNNGTRTTDYDFDVIPNSITGTTVYVDADGSAGDGTIGNPYNNLATAYNSGASILRVKGSFGFSNGFSTLSLSRSLKIIPYDSLSAEITTKITLTFSQNGTYPTVYQASNSQTTLEIGTVLDKTNLDARGKYIGLTRVNSITAVSQTVNSYYYDTVSDIVYIQTFDSRIPDSDIYTLLSSTITRACRFNSNMVDLLNRDVYIEGIKFYGGNPLVFAGSSTANYWNIGLTDCEFSHAGQKDGILVSSYAKGYVKNCYADYNAGDGFNYSANGEPVILEWDCSSWQSTVTSVASNNGSTSHLSFSVIRVNGDYRYHAGKAVQDINNSNTMSIGCVAGLGLAPNPDDYPFSSDSTGIGSTIMDIIECESLDAKGYRNYTTSTMNIYDGDYGNILTKTNLNEGSGVINILTENQVYL